MYCVFNSYNLNDGLNYEILSIEVQPASVDINKYKIVRADELVVTSKNYSERQIIVKGRILASDQPEADTKLDTFNSYLNDIEKDLIIEVSGSKRVYTATIEKVAITATGYHREFQLDFIANALSHDETTSSLSFGTYTNGSSTYANNILGNYKTKPTIEFTINQIEPYWTAKYIDINNIALNQRIRLTRTWNWYDRVVLNGSTKTASIYPTTKTVIDTCDTTTGWTSDDTLSLESTNMKEGVGALKIVMGSAKAVSNVMKINFTPTMDLGASNGTIILPVFLPTPVSGAPGSIFLYTGSDATLASNFCYWAKTTQWDGSAITTNAWNYFAFDLSSPTGTTGAPVRSAIKSILIEIYPTGANMRLDNTLIDYITLQKAGVTAQILDYEGLFPDLGIGNSSLQISDEFVSRNLTITGNYYKQYI